MQQARELAPIKRLQKYILDQNIMTQADIAQCQDKCREEVDAAALEYLARSAPPLNSMFDHHYASLPDYLIEQRATALEELDHAHD